MTVAVQHAVWRDGRTVLLACALTVAMFAVLPLLDALTVNPRQAMTPFLIDRIDPPVPPPAPPVDRTVPAKAPPRPRLETPRRLIPLEAVLQLDLALGDVGGDFELQFPVATPDLMAELDGHVFAISEIDEVPQPIVRMNPAYPPSARMRRIEGHVELEFIVGVDGAVSGAEVINAEPVGVFEQAALRAVGHWRFRPGRRGGEIVPVRVRQRLSFELGGL